MRATSFILSSIFEFDISSSSRFYFQNIASQPAIYNTRGIMYTKAFACHSLIVLVVFLMVDVSVQQKKCYFGNYCSGSYNMKAVCKGGYCYCTGQNYGYESCLPDAYGCRITMNSKTSLGKPFYNNKQRRPTYSCTPRKSSPRYEVHVLSVYEVINRRPPRAGDATVNIVSQGNSSRPIILVLGSYEPVNWILNLPTGLTISKVILVAYYVDKSSVKGDIGQVQSIEKRGTRGGQWDAGRGDDSGGGNTPKFLRIIHNKYGVVTSFTGTYKANKWSLLISTPQSKGTAATSTQSPSTASPGDVKITCKVRYMSVEFKRSYLSNVHWQSLHLIDPACRAIVTPTAIHLRTRLNGCGTTYKEHDDMLVFTNKVLSDNSMVKQSVIKANGSILLFHCKYSKRKLVSIDGFNASKERVVASEENFGNFTFSINMYKSNNYRKIYLPTEFPVSVHLGQKLWIRFKVADPFGHLVVFAETCRASLTSNPHSFPNYVFLKNGCQKDSSMVYRYNSTSSAQQFSIKWRRFIPTNNALVYIHCELMVCHRNSAKSRCSIGCVRSTRQGRDAGYDDTSNSYDLSTGPISTLKMHSGENDQNRGSDDTVQGTNVVLGLLGGLLVVICVSFIAKCTYAKILKSRNDGPVNVNAIYTNDGTAVSQPDDRPNGYAVRTNNVPEASRPALVNNLGPWTSRPEAPYPSYATVTNNVTVSSCPDDPPPLYALVSKHGAGDSLPDYPPPSYEDATKQRVAASYPNDPPPACVVRTDDGTTGLRRDDPPLGCAATTSIA